MNRSNLHPSTIKSIVQFIPEEILHEKQSLALCAVHAVNNLLQTCHDTEVVNPEIKHDDSCESTSRVERILDGDYLSCAGNVYSYARKLRKRARKDEFDEIADELYQKEIHLLSHDPSRPNWTNFMRISNHHRSLIMGNYSFEVIEVALERRGVTLERCHTDMSPILHTEDGQIVIGFIIHSVASTRSQASLRSLVGWFFTSGHHWYAISRLRRMHISNNTQNALQESRTNKELHGTDQKEQWYIIDSCVDQVSEIQSNKELICILEEARDKGGDIFRAVAKLDLIS